MYREGQKLLERIGKREVKSPENCRGAERMRGNTREFWRNTSFFFTVLFNWVVVFVEHSRPNLTNENGRRLKFSWV